MKDYLKFILLGWYIYDLNGYRFNEIIYGYSRNNVFDF